MNPKEVVIIVLLVLLGTSLGKLLAAPFLDSPRVEKETTVRIIVEKPNAAE